MKRYTDLLKQCGVETYTVTNTKTETVELFFIKKKLDMRRIENIDEISIAVYKDMEEEGKKLRGRAEVIANASMSDEEIIEKIKSADFSAQFVKNPFFELPDKEISKEITADSSLNGMALSNIADKFVEAVYSQDNDADAFINNLELFVIEKHVRIAGSQGTDVAYVSREVKGEFVAQCKKPQDVETYQDFKFDNLSLEEMRQLVARTLKMTKDRALATKMPKSGNYDVVISDKYMSTVMSYYLDRADAAYIYPGYFNNKIGDNIQGENIKGEAFNITLGINEPFNDEGIRMKERTLLEKGVLKTIHGTQRFCHYLGVEKIGSYSKTILPSGSMAFEDMIKRPCLHVVNFSDFQMDAFDGHFAGEIRLAYFYDGKGNVECLTGGSINGSFITAQKDVLLSKETQVLSDYVGPRAILIKNVSVAGE